jgi:hypothetical protein
MATRDVGEWKKVCLNGKGLFMTKKVMLRNGKNS